MAVQIEVRVTPRASRDRIERVDGAIKIWTTAAPTDGQANEAVRRLLAKRLSIAPSKIAIVRGDSSRDKVLSIEGFTKAEILRMLDGP